MRNANIEQLLVAAIGAAPAEFLLSTLNLPSIMQIFEPGTAPRAALAQAMNMAPFDDLLRRSAYGRIYASEVAKNGGSVFFDHGAMRTARWPHNGRLPPGEAAFTRILIPLGFKLNGRYSSMRHGQTAPDVA